MKVRRDPLAWVAFALAMAGIVWLAPLMADQLTFFGDREQTADAAAARAVMAIPGLLIAAGAALLIRRAGALIGGVVALPLVAVALAWIVPEAAYQLLAYGLTAPLAVGALLAACVPLDPAATRPLALAAVAVLIGALLLGTTLLALVAGVALAAWWRLSSSARIGPVRR